MQKNYNVGIAATGMVLPQASYTNDDIINKIKSCTAGRGDIPELNSKWIEENIWIKKRYFFSSDESMKDVSVQAIEQALRSAGWDPMELDFVILSSSSRHADIFSIPSLACRIQEQLKAYNAFAYDMSAACSGWVYAASQATAFIQSGMATKGVVICTEKQKEGLDFTDHRSSVLIGDIAVATLFEKQDAPKVKSLYLRANDEKNLSNIIRLPIFQEMDDGQVGTGYFALDGRAVFKEGVSAMVELTGRALKSNNFEVSDIDWFVYHQANGAMLRMVGRKVGMEDNRNLMNIQEVANTTAGTVPSVLHMYMENGTIKRGDKVCCVAFGGGLTSGYFVFEY
jgi:3-oxoacyl-[acyl-carrier-protein] synthase III